ncbi:MAG: allophanate hydrolase subunit 1 [Ilumatobacteraceae bacterium]|nr:allophanate hydrolase subunit 1 [Ilumatobacteraceae bacterium]
MTAPLRILPSGPTAMLVEYRSLAEVMNVSTRLLASRPVGVVDVVPAARTILITVRDGVDAMALAPLLDVTSEAIDVAIDAPTVTIEVTYDGDDLRSVADACGLTPAELIERHTAGHYTVAFCGFVPGFSYLVGLDPVLHLPRRPTPRTRVPAGAVAIASEFSAVYPTAGPGGWHLLGRTDAVMWDDDRPVPALLPPGTHVRFEQR